MKPIPFDDLRSRVFDAVDGKSDRDSVVLIVSWIDSLLERKLNDGSTQGRVPRQLSARIDAAVDAGWIDSELRDDLHTLRRIRNTFAHSVAVAALGDASLQESLAALRVPARQFYDWDRLGATGMPDGSVVIHTGPRRNDAVENLRIGAIRFKLGLAVIFSVLLASLRMEFIASDTTDILISTVPPHLMNPSGDI